MLPERPARGVPAGVAAPRHKIFARGSTMALPDLPKPDYARAMRLIGYQVFATVAEMGSLAGFLLAAASWPLGSLDVKGGD